MQTSLKYLNDTKVQFTVTLGSAELADAEQVALTKLAKELKVPGFRQGKVPVSVAAKHVDPAALANQTMDDAVSKAVAEAFLIEKLNALERPQVEVRKFVPGEELEFTAEVEVIPKVKLADHTKLTAKPEKATVKQADVDDVLERMRQGFAVKSEVDRPAEMGDDVIIDFVGKQDGVAFDGGTAQDYRLGLGAGQFIPGFEEGIVGHKPGETFDLFFQFFLDFSDFSFIYFLYQFQLIEFIGQVNELLEHFIHLGFFFILECFKLFGNFGSDWGRFSD